MFPVELANFKCVFSTFSQNRWWRPSIDFLLNVTTKFSGHFEKNSQKIAIFGPKIRFFEKCQNDCFFTFLPKIHAKSGVSDSELQNHSYMGRGKNGPRRVKNEVFGISSPCSCHPISRWIQKRSETLATDPNRPLFWRKSYTANPLG